VFGRRPEGRPNPNRRGGPGRLSRAGAPVEERQASSPILAASVGLPAGSGGLSGVRIVKSGRFWDF